MIEKYTGVPGSGKTAMAIKRLLEVSTANDRPIYVHGVPALRITHFPIKCRSPACDVCPTIQADLPYAEQWQDWAPDGAFIFIDEAQNVFRPSSPGSPVPPHISGLETHRHRGIDFLLVTQSPKLVHSNVRRLVSKHIHLAGTWARRVSYEWGECSENLSKTNAVTSTYHIPKHVFPLYQSASLHTRLSRRVPIQAYAFAFAIIAALFLGYRLYSGLLAKTQSSKQTSVTGYDKQTGTYQTTPQPVQSFDIKPVVPNHPETAPIYSGIVKVSAFPQLKGCIKSATKCTCYTQQATVYTVDPLECADYIKSARFDPYKVAPTPQDRPQNQAKNTYNNAN